MVTWDALPRPEDAPEVAIALAVIMVSLLLLALPRLRALPHALAAAGSRAYHARVVLAQRTAPPSRYGIGTGTVTGLFVHPVKSLRAVPQASVRLDAKGVTGDRRYMLVVPNPSPYPGLEDPDHPEMRFLTQRQCPLLATVTVRATDTALTLASDLLPQRSVTVPAAPAPDAAAFRAAIWGDVVHVRDMGDHAAAFFRALAAKDPDLLATVPAASTGVRLVRQAEDDGRTANAAYVPSSVVAAAAPGILAPLLPPPVSLVDGFPVLIACEASLEELNRRLQAAGKEPVPMDRFRPNLVIRGTRPFEEDHWRVVRIGGPDGVVLHVVKGCPRCRQSCTDQRTGRISEEPLAALAQFRALNPRDPGDLFFAQNAVLDAGMAGREVRVGDAVTVLQWRSRPVYEGG